MNLKRTALYPCSYLKNKVAKAEIIETTSSCSEKNFTQLMKNGYRRSGKYTYKPICENCSSCVPIRIPVNDFQPNKIQKRTLKRGGKLLTSVKKSLMFNEQEFFLFSKYQQNRHAGTFNEYDVENTYKNFLLKSCIETELVTFFDAEKKRVPGGAKPPRFDQNLVKSTYSHPDLRSKRGGLVSKTPPFNGPRL